MFKIIERKNQTVIYLTRGDSAEIQTEPFLDDNEENEKEMSITLSENDYIVFTIGSNSGKIYLRKLLTAADYNDQGILTLKLNPEDTINLQPSPCTYLFSFAYMPEKGKDCYTYATGYIKLLSSLSTTRDLKNILGG